MVADYEEMKKIRKEIKKIFPDKKVSMPNKNFLNAVIVHNESHGCISPTREECELLKKYDVDYQDFSINIFGYKK
jgi:hypothetical protein